MMLARPGPSGLDDVSVISVTVAPYSLRGGCSTPSASHDLLTKETPTMCGPAFAEKRTSRPSSARVM